MTIKPLKVNQKSEQGENHSDVGASGSGSQILPNQSQSPQRDRNAASHLYLDENVMAPSALRHRRSPHKRTKRSEGHSKRDTHHRDQRNEVANNHDSIGDKIVNVPSAGALNMLNAGSPSSSNSQNSPCQSPGLKCTESTTKLRFSQPSPDYSGYNSGDEHASDQKSQPLTAEEWTTRDKQFEKSLKERSLVLRDVGEDGACLFRAISLQIYGDEDMHEVIRQQTMDYIFQNREYFAQFVTEDIVNYVNRKRNNHVHGNHIEIQAISEIYNRPVELYCYQMEPINIFNPEQLNNGYEPLRLSYQRCSHYNAIINPYIASVGVGLGLAGYRPDEMDHRQMLDAKRVSEDLEIEKAMFEDKLKTTDWEATNEAIEEQIARESYLQWCRDKMRKDKPMNTTSSTITSSDLKEATSCGSASPKCNSPNTKLEDETNAYNKKRRIPQHSRNSIESTKYMRISPSKSPQTIEKRDSIDDVLSQPSSSISSANSSDIIATAGSSKQLYAGPTVENKNQPVSEFYQSLLESSYCDDGFAQLSEQEMLQKALHMSRIEFMHSPQQSTSKS